MELKQLVEIDLVKIKNELLEKIMNEIKDNMPDHIDMHVNDTVLNITFGDKSSKHYAYAWVSVAIELVYNELFNENETSVTFKIQYPRIRLHKMYFANEFISSTEQLVEIIQEVDKNRMIWER